MPSYPALLTPLATALTLAALHGRPADAQPAPAAGYTAFVSAGTSWIGTHGLNVLLREHGFSAFDRRPFAISAAAYRLLRSGIMLGGEWHYVALGDSEQPERSVGLGAGYATAGIGYAMNLSPRLRVYPRLGLGLGGMGLWTEEPDTATSAPVGFGDWLSAPRYDASQSTLSQASMAVDLGAGAELLLTRGRGPLLGVRAGYVAAPFDQGWTLNGRAVAGAPDASVAGAYVRFIVGWRREQCC